MTYYNVKICICMTYAENNWIVFIQGSRRDSTDVLKLSEICHTERFTTIELNHQLQEDQLLCRGNLCVCPSPIIKETADTTLTPQGSNLKGKFSPVDLTVGLDIQTFQRPQVYQLDRISDIPHTNAVIYNKGMRSCLNGVEITSHSFT